MFMSFDELPEEVQEEFRRQFDRTHMEGQALSHDLTRLFDELSSDQLIIMRRLLGLISTAPDGRAQGIASHFDGLASGLLAFKFKVCAACGFNHETQFLEDLNSGTLNPNGTEIPGQMELPDKQDIDEDEIVNICKKYGVSPIADQSIVPLNIEMPVRCDNCGQDYPSLSDRCLRPTGIEGCPGCQHKAKWG